MKRLPFGKSKDDGRPKSNRVSPSSVPWADSKPRPTSMDIPDSAPSLPPLLFGPEGASASTFDLGDMLVETKELPKLPTSSSSSNWLPTPPKDSSSTQLDPLLRPKSNGRRGSNSSYAGNRLSTINETHPLSVPIYGKSELSTPDSIPTSSKVEDDTKTEDPATIRELKMELAKYNPMSPLLRGAAQREYGLLLQKSESLKQQQSEMEEVLQKLHVKKDLMVMDLEAMEVALGAKEIELVESNNEAELPRSSTAHKFMKQTYQAEVKELQDQKVQLWEEIQGLTGQRDEILNEMQILSARNMDLLNMHDTIASEQPWQPESKPRPGSASSVKSTSGIIGSFTEKIRRPRQTESPSESDSWAAGNNNRSSISLRLSTSDDQEEETMSRRNTWRKSIKLTGVGAMFGNLLDTSTAGSNLEVLPTQAVPRQSQDEEGRSSGQHYFFLYNFVRPVRCSGCEDVIWGREYKCQYCGYQSHGKCTQYAYAECRRSSIEDFSRDISRRGSSDHELPPLPPKHIMFGNDLQDQVEREQRTIPLVVEKCIEAVDMRGLELEGIYRRSGMSAESRKLVEAFNNDHPPDLTDPEIYQDICSITSALKQFLRNLPEPLIPSSLYDGFMDAIDLPSHKAQLHEFGELVRRMPEAHFQTMKALMQHLDRVTQNSCINRMNAKNLSVVFGPTLMRNADPSKEIMDVTCKNLVIEFLILHTDELFTTERNQAAEDTQDIPSEENNEIEGGGENSSIGEAQTTDSPSLEAYKLPEVDSPTIDSS
ncbi:hypothetical protein BG003_001299 [Podila horticola]|nr:hypothetical protein BG003_001299 [Podila horticola]